MDSTLTTLFSFFISVNKFVPSAFAVESGHTFLVGVLLFVCIFIARLRLVHSQWLQCLNKLTQLWLSSVHFCRAMGVVTPINRFFMLWYHRTWYNFAFCRNQVFVHGTCPLGVRERREKRSAKKDKFRGCFILPLLSAVFPTSQLLFVYVTQNVHVFTIYTPFRFTRTPWHVFERCSWAEENSDLQSSHKTWS